MADITKIKTPDGNIYNLRDGSSKEIIDYMIEIFNTKKINVALLVDSSSGNYLLADTDNILIADATFKII